MVVVGMKSRVEWIAGIKKQKKRINKRGKRIKENERIKENRYWEVGNVDGGVQ
jgi:hypothetical protein